MPMRGRSTVESVAARPRPRSLAVVIFTFVGSPSTTWTRWPAAQPASPHPSLDAGSASATAARRHRGGMPAASAPDRSVSRGIVSDDHDAARRALPPASPCRAPESRQSPRRVDGRVNRARDQSGDTNGRAASCTEHHIRSPDSRIERRSPPSPADARRRRRPARLCRAALRSTSARLVNDSGRQHDDHVVDAIVSGERRRRCARESIGRRCRAAALARPRRAGGLRRQPR